MCGKATATSCLINNFGLNFKKTKKTLMPDILNVIKKSKIYMICLPKLPTLCIVCVCDIFLWSWEFEVWTVKYALHIAESVCTALHTTASVCTALHTTKSVCTTLHSSRFVFTALHTSQSVCIALHITGSVRHGKIANTANISVLHLVEVNVS